MNGGGNSSTTSSHATETNINARFRAIQPAIDHADRPIANLGSLPENKRRDQPHVTRACDACRTRKSKCDALKPVCSPCRKRGLECHYEPISDSRHMVRELKLALEEKDARLTELEARLRHFVTDSNTSQQSSQSSSDFQFNRSMAPPPPLPVWNNLAPLYRLQNSASSHSASQGTHTSSDNATPSTNPTDPVPSSRPDNFGFDLHPSDITGRPVMRLPPLPIWKTPSSQIQRSARSSTPLTRDEEDTRRQVQLLSSEGRGDFKAELYGMPSEILFAMVSDPSLAIKVPGYIFQPLASLAQQEPADMVYVSYRDEARKWLNSGVPKSEVLGAEEVAVDLLFRPRTFSDPFNVATWACEFNKSFGDQQCWYQLAAVSFMSRLMKWQIYPCSETFAKIPAPMRPTVAQRFVSHRAYFDLLPFPALRDALIRRPELHRIEWQGQLKCHWPHGLNDATEIIPHTNSRVLTTRFEAFAAELKNWSASDEIIQAAPELRAILGDHSAV